MTTFEKVKKHYIDGYVDWTEDIHRVMFSDMERKYGGIIIANVFTIFSRYFLFMYNSIFIENDKGTAIITCIGDNGIRVEYFEGEFAGAYEWINCDFMGNEDATKRIMVNQAEY